MALDKGHRGLPARSSLLTVFAKHSMKEKPAEKGALSEEIIVRWARAHLERTGELPTQRSGDVLDEGGVATGETWQIVATALRCGGRGLPASSLPDFFERHGLREKRLALSEGLIIRLAKAHPTVSRDGGSGREPRLLD